MDKEKLYWEIVKKIQNLKTEQDRFWILLQLKRLTAQIEDPDCDFQEVMDFFEEHKN
jgi:hypothetical protein